MFGFEKTAWIWTYLIPFQVCCVYYVYGDNNITTSINTTTTSTTFSTTSRENTCDYSGHTSTTTASPTTDEYTTTSYEDCGSEELTDKEGNFTSPGYPIHYHNRHSCTWNITVTEGKRIRLTVQIDDIETCDNCTCDWIEIFDGKDWYAETLAKVCTAQNLIVVSTGNQMFVNFESDEDEKRKGFMAGYVTIKGDCGSEELTDKEGNFTSPGYPIHYHNRHGCAWNITVAEGKRIRLTVQIDDIETCKNCSCDWIEIFDGKDWYAETLAKVCTDQNLTVVSTGNQMFVDFESDEDEKRKGFMASYVTI